MIFLKSVTIAGRGGARRCAGQERRVLWAVAAEGDGPCGLHRAGTKSRLESGGIFLHFGLICYDLGNQNSIYTSSAFLIKQKNLLGKTEKGDTSRLRRIKDRYAGLTAAWENVQIKINVVDINMTYMCE